MAVSSKFAMTPIQLLAEIIASTVKAPNGQLLQEMLRWAEREGKLDLPWNPAYIKNFRMKPRPVIKALIATTVKERKPLGKLLQLILAWAEQQGPSDFLWSLAFMQKTRLKARALIKKDKDEKMKERKAKEMGASEKGVIW